MGDCARCGHPSPPLIACGPAPRFCSLTCRAVDDLVNFAVNACSKAGTTDIYLGDTAVEIDLDKVADHRDQLQRLSRAQRHRQRTTT